MTNELSSQLDRLDVSSGNAKNSMKKKQTKLPPSAAARHLRLIRRRQRKEKEQRDVEREDFAEEQASLYEREMARRKKTRKAGKQRKHPQKQNSRSDEMKDEQKPATEESTIAAISFQPARFQIDEMQSAVEKMKFMEIDQAWKNSLRDRLVVPDSSLMDLTQQVRFGVSVGPPMATNFPSTPQTTPNNPFAVLEPNDYGEEHLAAMQPPQKPAFTFHPASFSVPITTTTTSTATSTTATTAVDDDEVDDDL
jgi:hypothetical protein